MFETGLGTGEVACAGIAHSGFALDRDGLLVLRRALALKVRDRAGETAVRPVATDRTASRNRSVDRKDGFRGVVALDAGERRPGSSSDHPTLTAPPQETGQ